MKHRRFLFVLACALLSTLGVVPNDAPAQERPFLYSMGRYTSVWAGRPRSYDEQCWDHMRQIGVRLSGAGLAWVDGEPTRGQYNWNAIDYADFEVNGIIARGMEVAFFLGLTPAWAALRPDLPPHRTPPKEEFVEDFMNFHRFVANRYKGRVKYYYFWNEPNGCSWINGCSNSDSYPVYTRWLIRCSQAVKQADPDAKIIAGRIDYHAGVSHGWQYIQGMYEHGAGPHIDGIAIHPYGSPLHWQAIRDTRRVMVENGDGHKPIWITEYGWSSGSEEERTANLVNVLTELNKPEFHYVQMAQYLVLNDGSGVEGYGLMDANLNPRQRYFAYRDFPKGPATATPTPTGPTPTPTDTPLPGVVVNGDFEQGFVAAPPEFQNDPNHWRYAAAGWNLWGTNWWAKGETYRSPSWSQGVATNWGRLDNALYQRVPVVPGARYRINAWVYLTVSVSGGNQLWAALGADATGGTSPTAASVVYTPETRTQQSWRPLSLEIDATGPHITVFVRCKTETLGGWQWCYIDDVSMELIDAPATNTPASPTHTPTLPSANTPTPSDGSATVGTY